MILSKPALKPDSRLNHIGNRIPERRSDLVKIGFRAMLGGTLACAMTACIAGMML